MNLIISWLMLGLSMWVAVTLLPSIKVDGWGPALAASCIFGLLSWFVRGPLFVLASMLTFGWASTLSFATYWLIGAVLWKLTGLLTPGVHIPRFRTAFAASVMTSATSAAFSLVGSGLRILNF